MNRKSVRMENEKVIVSVNNWNIEFEKGKRMLLVYNDNICICDNPTIYEVSPDQDCVEVAYDKPFSIPEYVKRIIRKYAYLTVDNYAVYTAGYNSLIAYSINENYILVGPAEAPAEAHKYKLYYGDDSIYFRYKGCNIPIDDFLRIDAI